MLSDPAQLALRVSAEIGLPFSGRRGVGSAGDRQLILVPDGHHAAQTFQIVATLGWRSLEVVVEPGAFSGDLVSEMGNVSAERRLAFREVLDYCVSQGAMVALKVNGSTHSAGDDDLWKPQWKHFSLSVKKGQLPFGSQASSEEDSLTITWVSRVAAALMSLLPVEGEAVLAPEIEAGFPEGALVRVSVNRYERDRRNRAAALAIHGYACKACEVVMAERYGMPAADFIEVHHSTPVSQLGSGYIINPRTDLIPLCPNCHAIAHRRSPPYSLAELREMIAGVATGSLSESPGPKKT